MITVVEPKNDLESIVKEMMMEMNGRLEMTQARMLVLETKNIHLEEELKITNEELADTKVELTATRDDLMSKNHLLERDVSIIRNPPFIHSCGSHYNELSITSQTIPYSSLLYSSTNTEGGGLDISTGVFTCPWPGSYTVTWSLTADDDAGELYGVIYLRKNKRNIIESHHKSWYSGPSGHVYDQGKPYTYINNIY